jgi:hypothetical protein
VPRPVAGAVALVAVAVVLAACGGGSGSTGSLSGGSSGTSAEAAWAKEVEAVMAEFENNVSAQVMPQIDAADSQLLLEPLYRTYGFDLGTLAKKLEGTEAPAVCAAIRSRLAGDARKLAAATKSIGHAGDLGEEEFGELLRKEGEQLSKYGRKLTELAADLHC